MDAIKGRTRQHFFQCIERAAPSEAVRICIDPDLAAHDFYIDNLLRVDRIILISEFQIQQPVFLHFLTAEGVQGFFQQIFLQRFQEIPECVQAKTGENVLFTGRQKDQLCFAAPPPQMSSSQIKIVIVSTNPYMPVHDTFTGFSPAARLAAFLFPHYYIIVLSFQHKTHDVNNIFNCAKIYFRISLPFIHLHFYVFKLTCAC